MTGISSGGHWHCDGGDEGEHVVARDESGVNIMARSFGSGLAII